MDRRAEQMGLVVELMTRFPNYRSYPLVTLSMWVQPAIEHKQIRFLFDRTGVPLAYWTWAYLAPDVEARWISDPKVIFHDSEWNEGNNLWILNFVAQRGYIRSVISHINGYMYPGHELAYSLRRTKDGQLRKKSIWRRQNYGSNKHLFFIHPPEAFADSRTNFMEIQNNGY